MNSSPTIPELLAPGGDPEAVKAAVLAGADAVYLGFSRFNARRRARNIEYGEFADLVEFARSRRTRIYVTLNILFREDELGPMLRDAEAALNTGADGLIVQDYGAARLLARSFPGVKLHASTQMTVHTSGQILLLSRFGFSRVNLARELSLSEIRNLTNTAHELGIETEVFVQGAYCVSYSGQCLASAYMGGQSGNRGACFQPCRRAFSPSAGGETLHALSLKDNCAWNEAGALAAAGVDAFKIEGRVKNAFYVHSTVSAWRRRLDRMRIGPDELDAVSSEQAQDRGYEQPDLRLLRIFNRGYHTGYLSGEVTGECFIETPLDRSVTVLGRIVSFQPDPAGASGSGRKVDGAEASTEPEETGTLTIEPAAIEPIGFDPIGIGPGTDREAARAPAPGTRVTVSSPENRLIAVLTVTGRRTALMFGVKIEKRHGRIIPGQYLLENRTEREAAELDREIRREWTAWCAGRDRAASEAVGPEPDRVVSAIDARTVPPVRSPVTGRESRLSVLIGGPDEAEAFVAGFPEIGILVEARSPDSLSEIAAREQALRNAFPLRQGDSAARAGEPLQGQLLVPWLPTVLRERDLAPFGRALGSYQDALRSHGGKAASKNDERPTVVLGSGALVPVCNRLGLRWIAGPGFGTANSAAIEGLTGTAGASGAVLSRELSVEQAVPVAATPADTWLTVFGPVRLMITRACPLSRWVGCGAHSTDDRCYETCVRDLPIEDAAGRKFRLVKRSWSWPELYGAEYATMPDAVRRLRGTVGRFILDLRTLPVHPLRTADKLEICRRFLGALRDDTAGAYGAGREETSERPDDRTFLSEPGDGARFPPTAEFPFGIT